MVDLPGTGRAFAGTALAVTTAGLAAALTHQPWLFPSLGPAIMLHMQKPEAPESSPRNTLVGHAVGLLAGYLSLVVCGLTGHPSVLREGVGAARIVAAALSLALTLLVLMLLGMPHPPAGATTLIVSLGLLHLPGQLVVMFAAVVLITAVGWLWNRATGARMPLWRSDDREPVG